MTTVLPPPGPAAPNAETRPPLQRMRWTVMAAALTAIATLYLNSGGLPFLIACAIGMLLSYIVPARMNDRTMLRWVVRGSLLFIIFLLNQDVPANSDLAIGGAKGRNIFGQFYAMEMLVQCWRQNADPARSRLITLAVSAMLMLTASNSFSERYVLYLAPLYLTLVALSFHDYRPRLRAIVRTEAIRAAALLGVLLIGFVSYRLFYENKGNLTEWGNRFLGEHMRFEGTGMVAQPTLGPTFGLRGSTARVLRIEYPAGDPHLRGMSFDRYDNGRWSPSFFERPFRPATPNNLRPARANQSGNATSEMIITRLAADNPLIYGPLNMVALERGEAEDMEWCEDYGGPFRTRVRPPYEYRVMAAEQATYQGLLATPITPERRERSLQVPERLDPGVAALAKRIAGDARTTPEKIDRIVNYLITHHSYSLTFVPDGGEPLASFLLSEPKKSAHCEYFASAAAILLRYVGVPTRYVTGYLAHENAGPGVVIVRQRDAHAWAEAWVDGVGWVTVDATPGDGRPDQDKTPIEKWRVAWEWFQDRMDAFSAWLGQLTPEQVYLGVAITVAGGILFGFVRYDLKRRQMRFALPALYSSPDARLADLTARFESVFAKRGVPFPEVRTYAEHLDALNAGPETETETAALTETARRFVRYYEEARFGSRQEEETLRALTELLEEMEKPSR